MFLLDFPKNMQSLKNIPPPRIFLLTPLYILELTSANTVYCEKGAEGAHCAPEFMMPLLAVLPFALRRPTSVLLVRVSCSYFLPQNRDCTVFSLTSPWHAFLNQTLTLALPTVWVLFFWDNVIANMLISQMFIFCC